MKKVCILLVLALCLSMVGCAGGEETIPTTEPLVTTEPSVATEPVADLTIENLEYATSTTIEDFWVTGTITSGAALTRMESEGKATSDSLGISVSDTANPFYFEDGVSAFELEDVKDYFVSQLNSLHNLYVGLADLIGADNGLTVTLNVTVYDAAGNSEFFTMKVLIAEDETQEDQALAVHDLETNATGTIEQFQISGTISSAAPLVKLECVGTAHTDSIAVNADNGVFYFEENTGSADMTSIREFLVGQMNEVKGLSDALTGMLDEESPLEIELYCKCYDEAGNTVDFEIIYVVTEE